MARGGHGGEGETRSRGSVGKHEKGFRDRCCKGCKRMLKKVTMYVQTIFDIQNVAG